MQVDNKWYFIITNKIRMQNQIININDTVVVSNNLLTQGDQIVRIMNEIVPKLVSLLEFI